MRDQCFLLAFVRIVACLRDQCFLLAFVRIVAELRCSLGCGTTVLYTRATCSSSQLVGHSRSQWQRSVARWWKGAAFTEKMNGEHEDEEFVGLRVSGHTKQNNDPPTEFTGTKPSEFKSYRENVKRWLLFT